MRTLGEKMSGIGMTSTRTRNRMVERLRAEGIRDELVLEAMGATPRHIFVDEALATRAYENTPLPIGSGQTISQPWVVARMSELARAARPLERVLEIGTGCGYQTAVLARIASEVYTVERIVALVNKARRNLQSLKVKNVRLMHGDGTADLGESSRSAIVVTAGDARTGLLKYLKPGGRMVLPLTQHGDGGDGVQSDVIEMTPGTPGRVRCGKICSVVAGTRVTKSAHPLRTRRVDAARAFSFHEGVRGSDTGLRQGSWFLPRRVRIPGAGAGRRPNAASPSATRCVATGAAAGRGSASARARCLAPVLHREARRHAAKDRARSRSRLP
jgi:protein-L-isoaspartate(D-aspartate) O-methyltransferase